MTIENIQISERVDARMRSLYHNQFTLPTGTPEVWNKELQELDPELSLRYNPKTQMFLVFYDHKGLLSIIRSFGLSEPFGRVFLNIKHNATLTTRKLRQMKKDQETEIEKDLDYRIEQTSAEFAEELHNAAKGRVITDGIDEYQDVQKDNDF